MQRLLLLRHAKADRPEGVEDHERALNPRGRDAAKRMGAFMAAAGYRPRKILCSTSTRTRETLARVQAAGIDGAVVFDKKLYLAEWPALLDIVRAAGTSDTPLMLVGHNPGIEQLALALALKPESTAERGRAESLAEKYPTCALAVLDFDVSGWRAVKPAGGRLAAFVRPRDLPDI